MCGDMDEEARPGHAAIMAFVNAAEHLRSHRGTAARVAAGGLAGDAGLSAYLDRLYADLAGALADDARTGEADDRALLGQMVALARLAGFVASHLPPQADAMRTVMEAVLDGYTADPDMDAHRDGHVAHVGSHDHGPEGHHHH